MELLHQFENVKGLHKVDLMVDTGIRILWHPNLLAP